MATGFKSHSDHKDKSTSPNGKINPGQPAPAASLAPHEQASLDQIAAGLKDNKVAPSPNNSTSSKPSAGPGDPSHNAESNIASPGTKAPAVSANQAPGISGLNPDKVPASAPSTGHAQTGTATGLAGAGSASPSSSIQTNKPSPASSTTKTAASGHQKSGGFGGRVKSLTSQLKKRRTQAYLAAALILGLVSMLAFLVSIPFKLIHIGHVLLDHNAANNEHTNDQTQEKLMERLFLDASFEDGSKKIRSGRPIHDFFLNNRIKKVTGLLGKQGITMEFEKPSGKLLSISKDGKVIKDFKDGKLWELRGAAKSLVVDELDIRSPLKRVLYTRAMRAKARVSFKVWGLDKGKSLLQQLASKVLKGSTGDGITTPQDIGPDPTPNDPNSQAHKDWLAKQQAAATGSADRATAAADAARAEQEKFQAKADKVAARKASIDAFRKSAIGKGFTWTGYATIYCMVRSIILSVTKHDAHYVDRAEALMREGNLLMTAVHEMEQGHVPDLSVFDQYMQRFDGDPTADPGTTDAKSFDQSAAWKRDTGNPVNTAPNLTKNPKSAPNPNYNPDLPAAANPSPGALSTLQSFVDAFLNLPGENAVCKVLNSWFGWVIGGIELGLSVFDGGTSDVAAALASTAFIYYVTSHILPAITDRANNLAVTGVDSAVDTSNIEDAGLNLSEKEYGRLMGDRQGSDAEYAATANKAAEEQVQLAKSKGWAYRTFAIEDNNSIFSQTVAKIPSSPSAAIATITTRIASFSNLPNSLNTLAGLFFHPAVALAGPPTLDPYGFRAQVTTDQEIADSDPYVYEDFLYNPIPLPGHTVPNNADGSPLTSAQLAGVAYRKPDGSALTRIDMLGDPTTYSPSNDPQQGNDSNNNDLMHCFVNKFRDPTFDDNGNRKGDDPICLNLGYITKIGSNNITSDEATANPGPDQVLKLIYCQQYKVCGLDWTHALPKYCPDDLTKVCGTVSVNDFDIFRIYMKYTFLQRGLACEMSTEDCFQGNGSSSAAPSSSTDATAASGDTVSLAKQLLTSKNFIGPGEPTQTLTSASNDQPGISGQKLHPAMLAALVTLLQTHTASISHIEDNQMVAGSPHEAGRAIDFYAYDGQPLTGNNAASNDLMTQLISLAPDGSAFGDCDGHTVPHGSKNITFFADNCNHVHFQVP
jgi:hypothetical protein